VALKIQRTGASDYNRHIKLLVCGDPGSGKTLLSSTFPNPIIASAEEGLMSIADRNIPFVKVDAWADLIALKNILKQDKEVREEQLGFPVETVVIDTIDEAQDVLIREYLLKQKKSALQGWDDYGYIKDQTNGMIAAFRNLDMNVVFTCHLKETSDDTQKVWLKPAIVGGAGDTLGGKVDLALVLDSQMVSEMQNKELVTVDRRVLITRRSQRLPFVKDRSGKLPAEFVVNFDDDYQRIHDLVYANVGSLTESTSFEIDEPTPKVEKLEEKVEEEKPKPRKAAAKKAAEKVTEDQEAPDPVSEVVDAPEAETTPEPQPEPEGTDVAAEAPESPVEAPVADGDVTPRNKLPEGVTPDPKGYGTSIFCVNCGGEVESVDQAKYSQIRFKGKVYDRPCFDEKKR
jgi:AAA domain